MSSNRTTVRNKEQGSYLLLQCTLNAEPIAALFFISYSSRI